MHQCRVYLPLDPDGVRALAKDKEIRATSVYVVTEWLEREHPTEDEEGLEYLALLAATGAALAGRAAGARTPVVVAAADVSSEVLALAQPPAGGPTARVGLRGTVALRQVVSLHVEEPPAGSDDDPDLLWYDVTELDEVVRLVG